VILQEINVLKVIFINRVILSALAHVGLLQELLKNKNAVRVKHDTVRVLTVGS
jgi:hypothetical protein